MDLIGVKLLYSFFQLLAVGDSGADSGADSGSDSGANSGAISIETTFISAMLV